MRILVIEDEAGLRCALQTTLEKEGFACDTQADGISGLDAGLSDIYDLIILDIMLPKLNGLDILGNLREQEIHTPILLLSARSEIEDKLKGFKNGADDYLSKPFDIRELLARVHALTRRKSEIIDNHLIYGDIRLDLDTKLLYKEKFSVKLGAKEFQVLHYLLINKNQILPKNIIFEKVWGLNDESEYNNVEVYISFIRKKLNYLKSNVQIKISRNIGYYLEVSHD